MATTVLKGQVSLDFGQEAKYVYFSLQKRAVMVKDWLARWASNPSLVRDMAHYLLATLFSLELRGAILCDIGPTNAMVRTNDPYARALFAWSFHRKLRHRGVGGFLNIFQAYPSVQAELERILVVAKQTGLQPAFQACCKQLWKGFSSPTKVWQCWKPTRRTWNQLTFHFSPRS